MTRRRATIRTEHDHPHLVAAALSPDNTDEMSTRVEERADGHADDDRAGGHADDDRASRHADDERASRHAVVTTIERETTGSLRTTADDYVTNVQVAQQLIDTTTQS